MRKRERKPTHSGAILREDYLIPMSLTIHDLAEILALPENTVSQIVNENGSFTPDTALRLSRAFDTSPDLWMNLQKNYDLWQAEHTSNEWRKVQPIFTQQMHSHE